MIKLNLAALIFLWSMQAIGQQDSIKHKNSVFIQLVAGVSVPLSDNFFSNPSDISLDPYARNIQVHDEDDGRTKIGYNIRLSAGQNILKSHWGIMLLSCMGTNPYNITSFTPPNSIHGNYKEYSLLGGLFFSAAMDKTVVDFKFLAGPLYFIYPGMSYNLNAPGNPYGVGSFDGAWNISQGKTWSIAYDMGINLKHPITKRLMFLLSGDVFISKKESGISQNIQYTDYYLSEQKTNVPYLYSLSIALFNINVGLSYVIGK